MRPRAYYATYGDLGYIIGVFHGAIAARLACGGRRTYKAFKTREDAEVWAAWWEYEREKRSAAFAAAARANMLDRQRRLGVLANMTL